MSETQHQPLVERVATRSGADPALVAAVLAAHAVPDSHVPAAARSLRVARLRLRGTKTGPQGAGPFDATFHFPAGVVMAVGANLRGKTTLLEALALCLRGEPRELQRDVAAWLTDLECDAEVNGTPTGFRVTMRDGAVVGGAVLEAHALADLLSEGSGATTVLTAATAGEYARAVDAFMLDRLSLEPLLAAVRSGGVQTHRWASYFGAVYPPAGRDTVLIGETVMAGLAGRLLSVFLDLPGSALLTRVKAARDGARHRTQAQAAARASAATATGATRSEQLDVLRRAREAVDALERQAIAPSASAAAADVRLLAGRLADAEADRSAANALHRQARAARQEDERALNAHRESAVARALFHGLDPAVCPRCEAPVGAERKSREVEDHACAVCARPVVIDDHDSEEDAESELADALTASTDAEAAALDASEQAAAEAAGLSARLESAEAELRGARDAASTDERAALELVIARAEGALAVLPEDDAMTVDPTDQVLDALVGEIEADLVEASQELFAELGVEIAALARDFGIAAVTEVRINRAARLTVIKGGVQAGGFSAQSPGERLRLRVATVLALLRVGHRRNIATHPGLLMLDSLKAEEVQDEDAAALLDALVRAAADTPGLQVLTTSADQSLPVGRLPSDAIFAPNGHDQPLW